MLVGAVFPPLVNVTTSEDWTDAVAKLEPNCTLPNVGAPAIPTLQIGGGAGVIVAEAVMFVEAADTIPILDSKAAINSPMFKIFPFISSRMKFQFATF
jgi:hypothetical protein